MALDPESWIGPYRIVETLGEGGMGVVYLADQHDPVRRRVAVKILKVGADSAQVLGRFEAERQALAMMDHPSIAKVLDAGATEDGRPYFVMEVVSGVPITTWCDEAGLTVQQRVRLFVDVCRAVQHAHQKGIIHRDLKPSNVMVSEVDGHPRPRIIDFGIAKAVEEGDFDGTQLTQDGQAIGTPAYMSPEQIEGSTDIDTRSDIYALGVLLYQLLVGALPFDESSYRSWATVLATRYRDRPGPAQRLAQLSRVLDTLAAQRSTTPAALRRDLAGDLGAITGRAMAPERDDRYETANGMALDLERYLSHQPVLARRANRAYAVRKFVRRNRGGVAFAATVVLGLIGFSAVTIVQAERIARARDEAEARRGQAEGLIDFMLSDLREKLEPLGQLGVLDDVGDQALAYFASIPEELFSEQELLSRSQALYQIGSVRLAEGRLPAADSAFVESLRLARELSNRSPENDDWLFGLGQAEFWAGELARRRGDLQTAERHFQAYRDVSGRLVARDPGNVTYLKEEGYSHTNLGAVRRAEGREEEALDEFRAALDVKREVVRADSSVGHRYDLSRSYNTVGIVLSDLGRLNEAAEFLESDIALKESLLDAAPNNATFSYRLSVSLQFLGEVLWARGDVRGALERFQRAEGLLEPLVAQDADNAVWRRALVIARGWTASLLAEAGRPQEALSVLSETVPTMARLSAANPEQRAWAADLANQRRRRGEVLLQLGREGEAEAEALAALGILAELDAEVGLSAAARRERLRSLLLHGDAVADRRPAHARAVWETARAEGQAAAEATGHRVDQEAHAAALARLGRSAEADSLLRAWRVGDDTIRAPPGS